MYIIFHVVHVHILLYIHVHIFVTHSCTMRNILFLQQEFSLERAMDRMVDEWEPMRIETKQYRDTSMSVMLSVDDIQTMLDDQIVKTQTMRGSPFIKPFEDRIKVSHLK